MKIPKTPFSTRLSGSAKETELRLRSIFQWKKKRPPVMLALLVAVMMLSCFGLFSCQVQERSADGPTDEAVQSPAVEQTPPVESNQPTEILERTTVWNGEPIPFLELTVLPPEGWKGLVSYEVDGEWLYFYHLATAAEMGSPMTGALYSVSYEQTVLPLDYSLPWPGGVIAVSDQGTYLYGIPSDVNWLPKTEAEYTALAAQYGQMEFVLAEGLTGQTTAEQSVSAVRSVLEGVTWDNTEKLTREDGEIIYEMPRNGEFFELLRLASDNLHPIDRPDEFATLPGGVFLELSDGSNGHISFFAGKNHPDVLARYVTNTVNESAIVEDFALYIFLLASSEHKYLELHDLDDDMTCETVVWISENNKRNIVIYDFYSGEPQRISVNEALGCAAAEYTGQIANIKSEYSNLIRANTADGSLLYRYSDGQFYYVCTLDDALRS